MPQIKVYHYRVWGGGAIEWENAEEYDEDHMRRPNFRGYRREKMKIKMKMKMKMKMCWEPLGFHTLPKARS